MAEGGVPPFGIPPSMPPIFRHYSRCHAILPFRRNAFLHFITITALMATNIVASGEFPPRTPLTSMRAYRCAVERHARWRNLHYRKARLMLILIIYAVGGFQIDA